MSRDDLTLPVVRDVLRIGDAPPPAPVPEHGDLPWLARIPVPAPPRPVPREPPPRPPDRRIARRVARRRPVAPLAVAVVLVGVFVTGVGLGQVTGTFALPGWLSPQGVPPPRDFPVLEPSRPTRLVIPSIGVSAPVHRVGIGRDGTIEVPAVDRRNEAGWYDESPTPGQFGPAVVVGHVDTRTGPAVFARLADLRPGASVEVTRRDRSVAVFQVNTVERFDKSALPIERVYGDFTRPGLRLITCGGRWVGGATGYADNVVVFASLVSARNVKA